MGDLSCVSLNKHRLPRRFGYAGGVDAPRAPADAEVFDVDVDVALTRRYHQLLQLQILDG